MVSVPIPTFVPQDAWYALTAGDLNPNIADSVPIGADLLPALDSSNTLQDGIVGSLDGGVIYLAGLVTQLDGGQGWFMWSSASMAVSNGTTVFCPFTDPTVPGRWLSTGSPASGPGVVQVNQIIEAGGTKAILASTAPVINVFVKGRSVAGTTTLTLPGSTFEGQTVNVKDANGDAGTDNIIVTGAIDGDVSDTLVSNYAARSYIWNTTEWSVR